MPKRILIMGLPGAGKTYFANQLKKFLEQRSSYYTLVSNPKILWFNADDVRKKFDDWDFSIEGRIRQSLRMRQLADESSAEYVICDFVAPLEKMRANFNADWTIWIDSINEGRYADTNSLFEKPLKYDFRIPEQNAEYWARYAADHIVSDCRRPTFNWRKKTVQQLGRFQPWHAGHRALFERLLKKTGQVCIMVRDCQGWNDSNPFSTEQIKEQIRKDLDPLFQGMYEIVVVPNIVHIGYGRDVGYTIQQEVFDDATHAISATKIRKEMGIE